MKKIPFLVAILSVLLLAGCVSEIFYNSADKNEGKGIAIMYSFYEENGPAKDFFGRRAVANRKYFSFAKIKSPVSGEEYIVGRPSGLKSYPSLQKYSFTSLPPGHYEVTKWGIGGSVSDYDAQRCGHIGFDISANDILVIKGLRPLSITDAKGMLAVGRQANFVEFAVLPEDYQSFIEETHHDLLNTRTVKVAELKSDNSAAFEECVRNAENKYQTMGE